MDSNLIIIFSKYVALYFCKVLYKFFLLDIHHTNPVKEVRYLQGGNDEVIFSPWKILI